MYLLVIPGRDTLRCLALATVDEPLPPSKMDLEAADKFVNYEVCVEVISKTRYWYPVVNDENVDSPSLAISDIPIYLPSWLPLLFIFSFISISLHLKLCRQVIDNNVFEE